jgi:hypothetical protein
MTPEDELWLSANLADDGVGAISHPAAGALAAAADMAAAYTEALRRFRERVEVFGEHIAQDYVSDRDDVDWPAVIVREVEYMVRNGPAAYSRYVDELDRHAARVDVDRQFRLIVGGLT